MFLHNENIPWEELHTTIKKRELFSKDLYFELSFEAANFILENNLAKTLKDYTYLMIKPETLILNKTNELISLLKDFDLVYYCIKRISHVQISELWKYAWSAASLIRIITNLQFYPQFDCVLLVLHKKCTKNKNACDFLTEIKGSTPLGAYQPHTIRYKLKYINKFMNYIHTPDDVADLLRELGIFFDWDSLIEIFTAIKNKKTIDYNDLRADLSNKNYKIRDTDPSALLSKLIIDLEKDPQIPPKIIATLKDIKNGKSKLTIELIENLRKVHKLNWACEFVIIITSFMEYSSPYDSLID